MDFPEGSNIKAPRGVNIPWGRCLRPFKNCPFFTKNKYIFKKEVIMKPREILLSITLAFFLLTAPLVADAQQAIFLVRHAEDVRSTDVGDRPLTEAGHRRAMLLATLLKDAGISVIFTSSLQRTIETAEPLATALKS